MTRLATILVGLCFAACRGDDPYAGGSGGESCLFGSYRDPGPGCTIPPLAAVTIDGRADEWLDNRVLIAYSASCCGEGSPGVFHTARTRDGRSLAVFMPIIGEPIADGSFFYAVHFRRYGTGSVSPGNVTTDIIIQSTESFMRVNGLRVYGIAIEAAFGPGGLELRVPVDALPYPGVAYVDAWLVRAANGEIIDPPPFSAQVCWDTAATDGPCSFF